MLTLIFVAVFLLLVASRLGVHALRSEERAIARIVADRPLASASASRTRSARRFPDA